VGAPIDGARVALQTNSNAVLVRAATAGLGVVELPSYVGDAHPDLARVLPERESPYAVWLVLHRDLRRAARVRAVCDGVAATFPGGARPKRA
jgi:DNA-binding transcriptional LysR family regulator